MPTRQKSPETRKPSEAEQRARARGMKGSTELAEQFAVNDDYKRELVRVAELPAPPLTEASISSKSSRKKAVETVNIDEAVMTIFREEAEEIETRLERFGIAFPAHLQQDLVDHLFSLLALNQQGMITGGGALARR